MLKTGLVSVTFRKLLVKDIINLAVKSGLDAIEWGGDVHVPHGDIKKAKEVSASTKDNGLEVAAYGSYYKVGCEGKGLDKFKIVLNTALELGASNIRIWAGNKGSKDSDAACWEQIIESSNYVAEEAKKAGILISYEYHADTLTDNITSAMKLYRSINSDNIKAYWQPSPKISFKENQQELLRLKPIITNVHMFNWQLNERSEVQRRALCEAKSEWESYLKAIQKDSKDHYVLLEFVKDDNPEQFLLDAITLKELVSNVKNYANLI